MKILHTSDLHLGRSINEESLYEDQNYILDEILKIVKDEGVNVIIIPGDIYDKSIPSVEATMMFNSFLTKLSELKVKILITSGNHDSNERLGFGSEIFKNFDIHIVTQYNGKIDVVTIDDVNFYMLPFLKPHFIKNKVDESGNKLISEEEYEKIDGSNSFMKWILDRENIDANKKNILLAHLFVMSGGKGPEKSESENDYYKEVGTLDAVDANLFDAFNYVALGHIHKPQKIKRDTIRYSGTPLKYAFGEVNDKKSVVLIDSDDIDSFRIIELKPKRDLRIIRSMFDDIIHMSGSDDIIKVELEDSDTIIAPMDKIRQVFPNAVSVNYVKRKGDSVIDSEREIKEDMPPLELFKNFFVKQHGEDMKDDESKYITDVINSCMEG